MPIYISPEQARRHGLSPGGKPKRRRNPHRWAPYKSHEEWEFFNGAGSFILAELLWGVESPTEYVAEYEPETFDLLGIGYTPDALLTRNILWKPRLQAIVEIKGPLAYAREGRRSITCLKQLAASRPHYKCILAECTFKRGHASWRFWLVPANGRRRELK